MGFRRSGSLCWPLLGLINLSCLREPTIPFFGFLLGRTATLFAPFTRRIGWSERPQNSERLSVRRSRDGRIGRARRTRLKRSLCWLGQLRFRNSSYFCRIRCQRRRVVARRPRRRKWTRRAPQHVVHGATRIKSATYGQSAHSYNFATGWVRDEWDAPCSRSAGLGLREDKQRPHWSLRTCRQCHFFPPGLYIAALDGVQQKCWYILARALNNIGQQ